MATRRNNHTETQVDDAPGAEFPGFEDGEAAPPNFESPFANLDGPPRLSDDQITGAKFNKEARAEAHAVMSAPAGDYTKTARWAGTFKRTLRAGDSLAGDVYPNGRVIYTINGKTDPKTVDGVQHQPTLALRLSPDQRPHAVNPGEFDFLYKTYDRICEVFLATVGRELEGEEDLQKFLEDGEYTMNTMVQDDGRLMVVNVKKTMKPGERRYQRR